MKSNKQFMILSALGIIFVIDDHSMCQIGAFTNLFPYDSFFMPMFVFISGYFFNQNSLTHKKEFFIKKFKNLFLPFFICNIIYGILVNILKYFGFTNWGLKLNFHSIFIEPFQYATAFDLNGASWFVMMLFSVNISYFIIRIIFNKIWNNFIFSIICISIGAISVYLCSKGYNTPKNLLLLKTMFFLQFYQLGITYKLYFEKYFKNIIISKIIYILSIIINIFAIIIYKNISFVQCSSMSGFVNTTNYILPLITSITGISFWLIMSDLLVPLIGDNKIINYISNHTFSIMTNHLLFFNMLNCILYLLYKKSIITNFDTNLFKTSAWYKYSNPSQYGFIYFIFGLLGCLALSYILDKSKKYILTKYYTN